MSINKLHLLRNIIIFQFKTRNIKHNHLLQLITILKVHKQDTRLAHINKQDRYGNVIVLQLNCLTTLKYQLLKLLVVYSQIQISYAFIWCTVKVLSILITWDTRFFVCHLRFIHILLFSYNNYCYTENRGYSAHAVTRLT